MADPLNDAVNALAKTMESQGAAAEALARTQETQGATLEVLLRVVETQQKEGAGLADAVRILTHQLGRMTIRQAEVMQEAKKRQEAMLAKAQEMMQGGPRG